MRSKNLSSIGDVCDLFLRNITENLGDWSVVVDIAFLVSDVGGYVVTVFGTSDILSVIIVLSGTTSVRRILRTGNTVLSGTNIPSGTSDTLVRLGILELCGVTMFA